MNRILKGLSKATIAVALLGTVATTNLNQPLTVQAAKKKAKKVSKKKAAKKSKKKATKKSKKKVVKKTTKKSKKKVTKKVVKKTPKKTVKKVTKKPAKKVVKTPSKPRTTVKKNTQKPASTPSQPAKQVVKKTTQADRYTPVVSSNAVKLDWGEDLTTYNLSGAISNLGSLPDGITVELQDKNSMSTLHGGSYSVNLVVTYPDGSKDVVGPASYVVATADADKYTPVLKTNSFNLKWDNGWVYTDGENFETGFGSSWDTVKAKWLTNEKGYFPNEASGGTDFDFVTDIKGKNDFQKPEETGGDFTVYLKTTYPDDSYSISGPVKLHFEPSDAAKYEPKVKNNIRIPLSVIKGDDFHEKEVPYVFENANELPKGTRVDGFDYSESGNYEENTVYVSYPDGSEDEIDETVNYQIY